MLHEYVIQGTINYFGDCMKRLWFQIALLPSFTCELCSLSRGHSFGTLPCFLSIHWKPFALLSTSRDKHCALARLKLPLAAGVLVTCIQISRISQEIALMSSVIHVCAVFIPDAMLVPHSTFSCLH